MCVGGSVIMRLALFLMGHIHILRIFGTDTKRLVSSRNVTAAKRVRLYLGMVKDHDFSDIVFFGFKYV